MTALSPPDVARLLTKAGSTQVTEAMIREDIEDGAPVNPDGTVNLIHFVAWLVSEEDSIVN